MPTCGSSTSRSSALCSQIVPVCYFTLENYVRLITGTAAADCGSASALTVQVLNNSVEASSLASQCTVLYGDVQLGPSISGDISLDGLENITGSLKPSVDDWNQTNTQLTHFESATLLEIGSNLDFHNATLLQTVSFPKLGSMLGLFIGFTPALERLDLSSLQSSGELFQIADTPALENLIIPAGLKCPSNHGLAIATTNLTSIEGFPSSAGSAGNVVIINNPRLKKVNLEITDTNLEWFDNGTLRDYTGWLVVNSNAASVNISLPNLTKTMGGIALGNCSQLSIPALSVVNGSFEIINASFKSVSAPNFSLINGDLNITGAFSG